LTPTLTPTDEPAAIDERLLWAARRLSELRTAVDAYLATAFKVSEETVTAASVATLTMTDLPKPELGLIAGDVINNLRACLDNLIWDITPAPARSKGTAFPVRSTDLDFAAAARRSTPSPRLRLRVGLEVGQQ
jgi:hypothetical protein